MDAAGDVLPVGVQLVDRDQRQSGVAHPLQHPVQRGLVDHRTTERRGPSSSVVRSSPSNQAAHRGSRWPFNRTSYRGQPVRRPTGDALIACISLSSVPES